MEKYLNKITCGDSYDLIKELPDKSVDLIVTDPPYLIENTKAGGHSNLAKSIQGMNDELANGILTQGINEEILDEFMRVMKVPNIYIWCNHKQIPMYLDYFVNKHKCSFDIIIWVKTNAMPLFNNKYLTDKEYCLYFRKGAYCNPYSYEEAKTVYFQPINITDKQLFEHTTIKPINIIQTLIKNSSKENDIVLDTFMGSGTTAVACQEIGRQFIGFEIAEKWVKVANDRLNKVDASGQQCMFLR
jgi:site-specific DNA-methyltransferase (adenine-specific)